MPQPLKILFLSAEVAPFTKVGGLGDVAGALPRALEAIGHDVRVVTPAYRHIEERAHWPGADLEPLPLALRVAVNGAPIRAGVFRGTLPRSDVPVFFVAERWLFDRPAVYGHADDPFRFAFFSRAAFHLADAIGWRPDVVHANDWHTAAAPLWLATAGRGEDGWRPVPAVFTIHNLVHQGHAARMLLDYLRVQAPALVEEWYGEVNLMARGIYHSARINTVSPTYASEMLTREGGAGLDGLLRHRGAHVRGILNGIDDRLWNPATDAHLAAPFDARTVERRAENKRALQRTLGLPDAPHIPVLAMITRLDGQKGLDIAVEVFRRLLDGQAGDAQVVVLGSGAPRYHDLLRQLAARHPGRMAVEFGYGAGLAPLIHGGADLFLMPSLFEPCGLGQMIAMRYGCVPLVRRTGGLADTVHEGVNGFDFVDYSVEAFWDAVRRALHVFATHRAQWRELQGAGMAADFSWTRSARAYEDLYRDALG